MVVEPLDDIMPALAEIGAKVIDQRTEREAGQTVYLYHLAWRGRLIRAAWSLADSLSVEVSATPATDPAAADWRPIFSYTVPGYDRFDDDQTLAWIRTVPQSPDDYPAWMAQHIRALPGAVSAG